MNDVLSYIMDRWNLDKRQRMPIKIPNSNRILLAKLFEQLGYRLGVEIGTGTGTNALTLTRNNPEMKLYCIDAWKIYDGLHDYPSDEFLQAYYELACRRLKPHKNVEFIRKLSMDAVNMFDDESLDFVYIDANHEWPFVTQDIFYWAKKVRPNGIVSGHDYLKEKRPDGLVQVKEVVHAYTEAFDISPWFVIDECTEQRAGSWFWVKT